MKNEALYTVEEENGKTILNTHSFKAEKGSVLHSGIFSKELASSFLAAIGASALFIFLTFSYELKFVHYVSAAMLFVILFPLSRVYLFKDASLKTVFDRDTKSILIILKKPVGGKSIRKKLNSLKEILIEQVRLEPENPDGIAFVKKIALQHGTVIPGFGDVQEFYNVSLLFDDDKYTILTTNTEQEAIAVVKRLKETTHGRTNKE